MARRYRKRYYRRSKGKWSANINRIVNQSIVAPAQSEFFGSILLTRNPAQSETSVSQQYTIKNVEFSFDIGTINGSVAVNQLESITVYIVYVPQGFTVDSSIITSHPEWIMAYRYLGGPNADIVTESNNYRNPLRVKTRLARRLQTGDGIYWLVTGVNESGGTEFSIVVNGIVRWWTKAN